MEEIKNKKICFFLADMTKKGGIERVTSILFNELLEKKINIDIVSQFKSYEDCNYILNKKENLKYITTKSFKEKPGSLKRLKKHILNLNNIRKFFEINKYDYIISQGFPNTALLYLAGVTKDKIIAAEHVYYGYYKNLIIKKVRKIIYSKIKRVVVLTNKDKEDFKKINVEAVVIYNPVNKNEDNQLSKLNSKKIISVGRLVEQKGFDLLIDSCVKVFEKFPEWHLDIYGEGPLKKELEEKIKKNNLCSNIFLKGTTSNIEEKYLESSLYVMSSRYEGFGMVLVEAMTKGLPCISFDCPNGPSDIIEDNVTGFLVEKENIDKLAEKIIFLIENEDIRKQFGKNGVKISEKFDKKNIIDKWETMIIQ